MKDITKKDLKMISALVTYINSIKKKINAQGEVTLTANDLKNIENVGQTLFSFIVFLQAQD